MTDIIENVGTTEGATETPITEPAATTGTDQATTGISGKTFSQAELDRIVRERLDRERKAADKKIADQYGDLEALKAAAAKLQEIEDANKSEAEKAAAQAAKLKKQLDDAQSENARLAKERTAAIKRASVLAQASKLGFADPADAWRFIDVESLEVTDDDSVKGVEDALKALAESKPYLLAQQDRRATGITPTALPQGGGQVETREQRRQRLMGRGENPFGKHGGGVYNPDLNT